MHHFGLRTGRHGDRVKTGCPFRFLTIAHACLIIHMIRN